MVIRVNTLLRLRSNAEFQRVFGEGRSVANRYMAVYFLAHEGSSRIGITVSRRLGGAVARNRIRRRIREAVRRVASVVPPGWDLVIVARRGAIAASFAELERGVALLFQSAGMATQPE